MTVQSNYAIDLNLVLFFFFSFSLTLKNGENLLYQSETSRLLVLI